MAHMARKTKANITAETQRRREHKKLINRLLTRAAQNRVPRENAEGLSGTRSQAEGSSTTWK
jgi:hypothetical protein